MININFYSFVAYAKIDLGIPSRRRLLEIHIALYENFI